MCPRIAFDTPPLEFSPVTSYHEGKSYNDFSNTPIGVTAFTAQSPPGISGLPNFSPRGVTKRYPLSTLW